MKALIAIFDSSFLGVVIGLTMGGIAATWKAGQIDSAATLGLLLLIAIRQAFQIRKLESKIEINNP